MDPFSTHLNLMGKIFEFKDIKTSLEFGMGNFSTQFLINNTKDKVTSIEMQFQNWFDEINTKFSQNDKWKGILSIGSHNVFDLKYEKKYDLVLVDGHVETRPECVNFSSSFCDTIVAHDTEAENVYGWSRVNLSEFYTFEDRSNRPWTKVWSKDKSLIEFLKKEIQTPDFYKCYLDSANTIELN
jgi:hypothetical protein